ncbi:SUKH-3 immunity protein of toxin-antitoxin system [Streptomyces sp. TLI_235]|nr:SUKH-3 domain-containing protein [Streptomyces sp. TLI_235]PBC69764.1 SUKH-3 immunity protein of toxin-antitoxin system [Streptomyces sp. TLI_235]PBC69770.1 SUKH-3 immunity protein of toxin-antitoxin system [Streptomyces sp. TLI_235]
MDGTREFKPPVAECLRAAGWHDGRTCDVRATVDLLEGEGFQVNECALAFFAEFDGILLQFPNPKLPRMTVEYSFGGGMRIDLVSNRWVRHWGRFAGEDLTPVGTDQRGYGVLLAGISGAYYFGFDSSLFEIADSAPLFFERLMSRESWRNIDVDVPYG